jgi:hypothetical protein
MSTGTSQLRNTVRPDSLLKPDTIRKAALIDTSKSHKARKHSALKAVWMSAVLPGLGQGYNRKYWKIPVIYAGFGGLGYALYYYGHNFYAARAAYRLQVDEDPNTTGIFENSSDPALTKRKLDFYKSWTTNFALITVLWYALNLVDAAVDGHLYHYNMDDKISLHIEPTIMPSAYGGLGYAQSSIGVKLTVDF